MPTIDYTQFRAEDTRSTKQIRSGVLTGPASYVTGGDPVTPNDLKLGQIHFLDFDNPTNGTVVIVAQYDYTNQKVKYFDYAGNEIAQGTNLSTYTVRFEAVGL